MYVFPVIDMQATGKNIAILRKKEGWTVRHLADVLGLQSAQAIYKWQSGESLPTIDNLVILARLFRTSVEGILVTTDVECEEPLTIPYAA